MPRCTACGERFGLGGRHILRKMQRIEALVGELQRAHDEAPKTVSVAPSSVRGSVAEVTALLQHLVLDGRRLVVDLHDAAHDRTLLVDRARAAAWQVSAERVLFGLSAEPGRRAR